MPIAYTPKINQRSIGSELLIVNESHIVGISSVATISTNQIRLLEVPLQESPSSVAIPGYTEVTGTPGSLEFHVDYSSGRITFNSVANGFTVFVTYKGRGSIVDAEDINEIQQVFVGSVTPGSPTIGIANLDGTLSAGIVRPSNISTVATDDFLFPNHVVITGNLTVNGTTTTINTDTVTIEDNIVLLNSNVTGAPSFDAGIEVERGTSPNVQLIWDETDDAWSMNDTSGNPILEAFNTGAVVVPGTLSVTGQFKIGDGTVSAPGIAFSSQPNTGMYKVSSSAIGLSINGTEALHVNGSGLNIDNGVIYNTDGTVNTPAYSFSGSPAMGMYRAGSNMLAFSTSSTQRILIDANGNVGIGVTPVAQFHNAGSTLFGMTSASNPSSIATATVDSFSGTVITTTAAATVTISSPTSATAGRFFTVMHNDTSTGTLSVAGFSIGIGKGIPFMWDGSAWIPVGGSGGFNLLAGNPGAPQTGDTWFNTVTNQFMGYNGTTNVILG